MLPGQLDLLNYEPPHQRHSDTSKAAADSIKHVIGPLHVKVLDALEVSGGLTDEELCDLLCLGGNTLRPRRRELELMNRVRDSGKRRRTMSGRQAVIWEKVEHE